jgi:hypothetical protein
VDEVLEKACFPVRCVVTPVAEIFLVDLPSDVMRSEVGRGTVIAVEVSPVMDFSVQEQFGLHLSGWRVAWNKVNPFSRKPKAVTIAVRRGIIHL